MQGLSPKNMDLSFMEWINVYATSDDIRQHLKRVQCFADTSVCLLVGKTNLWLQANVPRSWALLVFKMSIPPAICKIKLHLILPEYLFSCRMYYVLSCLCIVSSRGACIYVLARGACCFLWGALNGFFSFSTGGVNHAGLKSHLRCYHQFTKNL